MTTRRFLLFWVMLLFSINAQAKYLSPYDFGLAAARDGVETYRVLLKTHEAAVAQGCNVTYKGIEYLELDIPADAKSIPLPQKVDFHGVRLIVRNTSKTIYLFSLTQEITEIGIDKWRLSKNDYSNIKELNKGYSILIIEDKNPWVEKREGYNYGATRKDIVLVRDGWGENDVVFTYNNYSSDPQVSYCKVSSHKKRYSNLIFERTNDSNRRTELFLFQNQYNVLLKNIVVKTPKSELYGDGAFTIRNCAKIYLYDVTIDGTYSAKNKYGYGISMDNVWNSMFVRLKGKCEWGLFGNYNVNYAVLKECDINRFDIHCYGRDVYCYNSTFSNFYNQFSSFYGELVFKNCHFINYIPVLFEPSFYAYTPFNLTMKNCVLDADKRYPYLINAGSPADKHIVTREELKQVSWPNLTIDGLVVNLPEGQDDWVIFGVNGTDIPEIENLTSINIKGLLVNGYQKDDIPLSNKSIKTKEPLKINVKGSSIKGVRIKSQ